jgi:hypothetical protein
LGFPYKVSGVAIKEWESSTWFMAFPRISGIVVFGRKIETGRKIL